MIHAHAPARGATQFCVDNMMREIIHAHAPARGATILSGYWPGSCVIHAHAPARGATEAFLIRPARSAIHAHAPARGATDDFIADSEKEANPRSRSREGSDQRERWKDHKFAESTLTLPRGERHKTANFKLSQFIGIHAHAPARGATAFIDIFSFTVRLYFISSH